MAPITVVVMEQLPVTVVPVGEVIEQVPVSAAMPSVIVTVSDVGIVPALPTEVLATVNPTVTALFTTTGFGDTVPIEVVVVAGFTVCPPASEPMLSTKLVSPLYAALTLCGDPLTVSDAVP